MVQEVQADPAIQEHHCLRLYLVDPVGLVHQGVLLVDLWGLVDQRDLRLVPLGQVDQARQVDQGRQPGLEGLVRQDRQASLRRRASLALVWALLGPQEGALVLEMAGVAESEETEEQVVVDPKVEVLGHLG